MPDLGKTTCGPFQNREWRQAYSAGGGGLSPTEMYAREMEFRENLVKYNITCRGTQGGIVPTDGELWEILRCHDEELAWGWDDYRNTFIGLDAAYTYSHLQNDYGIIEGGSAYDNVVVGYRAGYSMSGANTNVVIGSYAGYGLSATAEESVVMGYSAAYGGGHYGIIAIGFNAAYTSGGVYDTIIGWCAAEDYVPVSGDNVIIGDETARYWGMNTSNNDSNVIVGSYACRGETGTNWGNQEYGGEENVVIGYEAGYELKDDSQEAVVIGSEAAAITSIADDSVIIGGWAGTDTHQIYSSVLVGTDCMLDEILGLDYSVAVGWDIQTIANRQLNNIYLAATAGAGLGIGNYYYGVSAVIDGYETPVRFSLSSNTVTTTSGNQRVTITVPTYPGSGAGAAFAGFTCTARKIYRTKVNGHHFYLLTTISDNTTTSYVDSTADTSLTQLYYGFGPALALGPLACMVHDYSMVVGDSYSSSGAYYANVFWNGVYAPSPQDVTHNACGGRGTNVAGADLILAGGRSTGNATPGQILFKVGTVGASGTALQTLATVATISGTGITVGTDPVVAVPTPALGDIIYGNATPAWAKLAGNTTTTRKWLTQTGTGAVSAAPSWETAPGAVWSNIASNPQAGEYRIKYLRLDSSLHMVVVYDGTPEVAPASYPTIISNPGSGEYRIKALRLDSGLNIVVVYDGTPEP